MYLYGGVPALILILILPVLLPAQLIESTILLTGSPVPSITFDESVILQILGPLMVQMYVVVPVGVIVALANEGPVPDGGAVAVAGFVLHVYTIVAGLIALPLGIVTVAFTFTGDEVQINESGLTTSCTAVSTYTVI